VDKKNPVVDHPGYSRENSWLFLNRYHKTIPESIDLGNAFHYNKVMEDPYVIRKKPSLKSVGYHLITRLLDVPVFIFIIFGHHGLNRMGKVILGTLYWAFPLFILGKCPLYVLVRWLFEGRRTGPLVKYMHKVYGRKRFILAVIFILSISTALLYLVLRTVY
jgi:hypothetical protein